MLTESSSEIKKIDLKLKLSYTSTLAKIIDLFSKSFTTQFTIHCTIHCMNKWLEQEYQIMVSVDTCPILYYYS